MNSLVLNQARRADYPLLASLVDDLRSLQAKTIAAGGPFAGMADNLGRNWQRVVKHAEIEHVAIHDLRRTFVSRLISRGVDLPSVQRLAGHANITTTIEFYNRTDTDDLVAAIDKLEILPKSCPLGKANA